MKLRSTTPVSTSFATRATLVAASILMIAATPIAMTSPVKADRYDEQIAALQREIDQYNNQASKLGQKRQNYENQLAKLNNEKAKIQAKIDLTVAKAEKLARDIAKSEREIAANKSALGETIADMYVDDNISPLEMLASSKNIGDYVDKQTYQATVQDTLTGTIEKINELKKQLEQQEKEVKEVLADQKFARNDLSKKEAEKQRLISQTRGRESAFQRLSSQTKQQQDKIQAEQQAAIEAAMRAAGGGSSAVAGDPNKGGYPDYLANSDYYNPVVDDWGMYSRQCVSYTAWKVHQKNGRMPYWGGRGNANQWPGNAVAAGIPIGSTPRAKSVGVISAGQYGHVVWVEKVNGDGTINISQYNYYNAGGSGWGHYSEMYNVSPSTYDTYIYF